jgi:hypothetical protein
MVMEKIAEVAKEAEDKLNLPPLSKLVDTVNRLPDEKRLKSIKDVLIVAERVSQNAPELDKVISLIHELNSVPPEKLIQLEKLLKRIEKIIKAAPDELLSFLASLKE